MGQDAAGRLDALGPEAADAARMAHREYYLALAEAADPQLRAAGQDAWQVTLRPLQEDKWRRYGNSLFGAIFATRAEPAVGQ